MTTRATTDSSSFSDCYSSEDAIEESAHRESERASEREELPRGGGGGRGGGASKRFQETDSKTEIIIVILTNRGWGKQDGNNYVFSLRLRCLALHIDCLPRKQQNARNSVIGSGRVGLSLFLPSRVDFTLSAAFSTVSPFEMCANLLSRLFL